ncbi:cupin domain-containing protein [Streptomyces huasconensis]|uniref:cupin domain-containing protein n=1 Tax=Streptomyces huasconensis TaxID=1854574 RepID=UPI0033F2B4E9
MIAPFDAAIRSLGEDFLAGAFGRSYQHWSQAADLSGLFAWDDLNEILTRHQLDTPRLRLFKAGEQVPTHLYTHTSVTKRHQVRRHIEPAHLHEQIADGASLVLDSLEGLHPGVESLAEVLERHFRTDVQINMYASWTPTEGFGVHWDDHDVVVFQLEGSKRWRLYGPTRPDPLRIDVEAPEKPEGEPLHEVMLEAGDMLYLPRGWWHAVAATEGRSLHLTCGLTPKTGHSLLTWVVGQLLAAPAVRATLRLNSSPEELEAYVEELRTEITKALHPRVLGEYINAMDARDPGRPAPSLPYVEGVPAEGHITIRLTTARASLLPGDAPGTVVFRAAGEEWVLRDEIAPALESLMGVGPVSLGKLAAASGLSLETVAALASELVSNDAAAVT